MPMTLAKKLPGPNKPLGMDQEKGGLEPQTCLLPLETVPASKDMLGERGTTSFKMGKSHACDNDESDHLAEDASTPVVT